MGMPARQFPRRDPEVGSGDDLAFQVTLLQHRVRAHGGMGRYILVAECLHRHGDAEFTPIRKRQNISTSRRP